MNSDNESSGSDDDLLGITHEPLIIAEPEFETPRVYKRPYKLSSGHCAWDDPEPHKTRRYQRLREIPNISGFMVHIHDATNYDVDLDIPSDVLSKYADVISNTYTYKALPANFLSNPDIRSLSCTDTKTGTTYRCRLRGVGINHSQAWKHKAIALEVKQLIDRTNGWITCTISDIDVYNRILVDIVIHTRTESINLRDYLLTNKHVQDDAIFYAYPGKRS